MPGGLSFSVNANVTTAPRIRLYFVEMKDDVDLFRVNTASEFSYGHPVLLTVLLV